MGTPSGLYVGRESIVLLEQRVEEEECERRREGGGRGGDGDEVFWCPCRGRSQRRLRRCGCRYRRVESDGQTGARLGGGAGEDGVVI